MEWSGLPIVVKFKILSRDPSIIKDRNINEMRESTMGRILFGLN